jgi:predicted TIM-barrel fold metal-dependent hydrolase
MIVDAHVHLGEVSSFRAIDTGPEAMLALMDALSIDVAISMHALGLAGLFEQAYTASEAAYERSGGRLPYCLVYHPLYREESLAWAAMGVGRPGMVGLKINPGQHQVYPEDERYEPVWEFATDHDLPMITHSWAWSDYNPTQRFATPEHFERFVAKYPTVKLVLGHAGGRYEGHLAAVTLAKRYANVYLDLSGDVYSLGFVEWLVEQVGAERVLLGSDMDWIDPRTHLARVLDAEISLEAKEMILGQNACRLFRLAPRGQCR